MDGWDYGREEKERTAMTKHLALGVWVGGHRHFPHPIASLPVFPQIHCIAYAYPLYRINVDM
jgi:hypothetical protein